MVIVGYWSTNVQFCSGSKTSKSAAEGSPCRLFPFENSDCWYKEFGIMILTNHCSTTVNKCSWFYRLTILSTSSSRITGFLTPTFFKAFRILPGIEPMYVRLIKQNLREKIIIQSDVSSNLYWNYYYSAETFF